jgi:S1-C subfamily serine protease
MADKTKIIMNDFSMTTQMAFGQIQRQTMLGNNKTFNEQVESLNSYKKYFMNSYGLYEGKVSRGKIGIGVDEPTDEMRQSSQLSKDEGILIVSLVLDGPAYNAGIKKDDILVSINDVVVNLENLLSILGNNIGKKVSAVVIRDGQRKTLSVVIAD